MGGIPWQVVVGDNLLSVVVVVEDRHPLEFGVVVDTLVVVESDSLKKYNYIFCYFNHCEQNILDQQAMFDSSSGILLPKLF